jgi:hypothetical protein
MAQTATTLLLQGLLQQWAAALVVCVVSLQVVVLELRETD